ncbi:MAG: hypothetical protein HZC36_10970 [Armatimonadetes bacterium]|nr:hypothetical protein [Armatimonadota bacterium]
MAKFKEGDTVRIVTREVTPEDRAAGAYFDHMAGLTGTVQNIYPFDQIAVKVEKKGLSAIPKDVHKVAVERMRDKFLSSISEEQKKALTPEELNFDAHYMLLVKGGDLEKA